MTMKRLLLLSTAVVLAASVSACQPKADKPGPQVIDANHITQDVKVLSSDAFEGRGPVSAGEDKTIAYITEQFKAAGLQPGGDLKDGQHGWTQDVPLARFQITGAPKVSVTAGGQTLNFSQGEQVSLRATQTGQTSVDLKNVPIVFAGYGVTAPERNWDDFKGMDVKGKLLLVLVNDPDFETGKGDFGGKAMTYYGRWTYKYEEAARRGAAGLLVIHETAPAAYGWNTVKNSNTNEIYDIIRADPTQAHAQVEGWIQGDVAAGLLKSAGLDFAALKQQAQTRDFKPVELTGATFSASYAVDARKVVSHNVVAVLPGAKHPDEHVIFSAHWDHLGVGLPDATGDKIFNGAVDNATGTALLMELGRAFAKGKRPDRSLVFLAVTAEEKGLLGSAYYAANPLYPLATTVADINVDALSPVGPAKDISTSGAAPLSLVDDLAAVAQARNVAFTPPSHPETGTFYRSDHFPFAKAGLPALSVESGEDWAEGGKAAGEAWSKAYNEQKYHQPADQMGPDWRSDGIAATGQIVFDLGAKLANSRDWPVWKDGAEFKAERDKTAAMRK
jgi:Zn-dependent M28 family amino/carboxypeptidase